MDRMRYIIMRYLFTRFQNIVIITAPLIILMTVAQAECSNNGNPHNTGRMGV